MCDHFWLGRTLVDMEEGDAKKDGESNWLPSSQSENLSIKLGFQDSGKAYLQSKQQGN